ncbi:MAG: hypothetical protein LBJ75_00980 [Puniceicoccales bacterium]|jgi:type III secretion protein C|nr:hypothetical protein [Puniceicoccales bacterium]
MMGTIKKFFQFALVFVCCALYAEERGPVGVSPYGVLPFSKSSYYHFAKDQSLPALIQDFFSMQGITVVISDRINYTVNGKFSKMDPAEFWNYITKAYGLVWFFDGKIMFVYTNAELQTQIFRMDPDGIGTLSVILSRLGFVASDFSFRDVGEANVLIVTAPPQYINVINDIATKFVPSKISDTTIVKIIPLKYAWAYDMTFNYANGSISVPGVSSLLQSIVTGQQLSAALSPFNVNVGGNQKQIEYQQMVGMLDDTPPYAKDINNNIKNMQKDGKISDNGKNDKSSGDKSSGDSNSVDISGTSLPGFITCDQRLNAIIIRDRRENMPFYEEIISKLDVPCEVIKIDVAIVDVNKSSSLALGIPGIHTKLSNGAEIGLSMIDSGMSMTTGNAISIGDTVKGSIAGHLGVIKSATINPVIDALEKNSNGQAVSRPSVLTLDNVAAILETDKVHYATISGANNSNAYTQSATTKLQVVPHIIPGDIDGDGKHKMKLFVDISDGSFDAVINDKQAPAVTQHSLNTQSVLYEGQSLVIGGYDSEINQKKDSGIPILQHLPLVGMLFKHTTDSKEIKERIYVISPSVVEIRSDDHKYDRFVQNGQLTATGTLESDDYPLTTQWPKEKRSKPKRPNPRLN